MPKCAASPNALPWRASFATNVVAARTGPSFPLDAVTSLDRVALVDWGSICTPIGRPTVTRVAERRDA
jgi:hypothetical protein